MNSTVHRMQAEQPAGYYHRKTGERLDVVKQIQPHGIFFYVLRDGREVHESNVEWRKGR